MIYPVINPSHFIKIKLSYRSEITILTAPSMANTHLTIHLRFFAPWHFLYFKILMMSTASLLPTHWKIIIVHFLVKSII
uniref:Uncharacterized protein n=1 Tax=Octopus bimaculoides TaxID=37653 RepID=A0A0L8HG97_OCTBM